MRTLIMHVASCDRCKKGVELATAPKQKGFLCNSCWLSWRDLEEKMIKKGCYRDELSAMFVKFVNSFIF